MRAMPDPKKPVTAKRAYTTREPFHLTLDEIQTRIRDRERLLVSVTLCSEQPTRPAKVIVVDGQPELHGEHGVRVYAHGKGWDLRRTNGSLMNTITDLTWRHA